MAAHAISTADLGVKASGATINATGSALTTVRTHVAPRLAAFRASLSAFGARVFAAIEKSRTEQALDAIERFDWRLAAQLRAEREGTTPTN